MKLIRTILTLHLLLPMSRSLATEVTHLTREFQIAKHYLNLPVANGAPRRTVSVWVEGKEAHVFHIGLADTQPDWWAAFNVSPWHGKTVTLRVDELPANSSALTRIEQSDTLKGADALYREPLRPQFHFSSRRGWNNDPNGLCFYRGEYHLFFQHNPYGWTSGFPHWGHAVSQDLVHWHELDDALAPDELGHIYSGSAVVDWHNTSGFGQGSRPPLVLIYTGAGHPPVQCLAYSCDGRNFTKYSRNPVVKHIGGVNRDPRVIWHEPTRQWVMVLFVDPPTGKTNQAGKKILRNTLHFLTSPNLKDWTPRSEIEGFHECPELFEIPLDGNASAKKWVLSAANSDYMIGMFDGAKFTPETAKLKGQRGKGYYAPQTFSDLPDGRHVQLGWINSPTPGMPFNQMMSLPFELKLITTAEGPRLTWTPIPELKSLRRGSPFRLPPGTRLEPGVLALGANAPQSELLEIRAAIDPNDAQKLVFNVRGIPIVCDLKKQTVKVDDGTPAPAPLVNGEHRLVIYIDRTSIEVTAADGLTFIPRAARPKAEEKSVAVCVQGGAATVRLLEIYQLKSAWY